jgi:hypothetical protein
MDVQTENWDSSTRGILTIEAIRQIHVPNGDYRISPNSYPSHTRFAGFSRAGTMYVLSGSCLVTANEQKWHFSAPSFATLPEGRYTFGVFGDDDVQIVSVWELPVGFREQDRSNEHIQD